ncbi:MAG: hypothetical protein QM767_19050 [Anaeromyxobacter sp.]
MPRFQRLLAPGRRRPGSSPASLHSAQSRQGWPSAAPSRSGASSCTSSRRRAAVKALQMPTWCSTPSASCRPSRSEPTMVPFPSLCQRKPATTQSAVRACFTFTMARLPGW